MIYFLSSPYSQHLINTGVPIPEITIEKIEFHDNQILLLFVIPVQQKLLFHKPMLMIEYKQQP